MKPSIAAAIAKAANNNGLEVEVYDEYAGRGMYGKTTSGLVGSQGDILKAVAVVAHQMGQEGTLPDDPEVGFEEFVDALDFSWDSMGHDRIAY